MAERGRSRGRPSAIERREVAGAVGYAVTPSGVALAVMTVANDGAFVRGQLGATIRVRWAVR